MPELDGLRCLSILVVLVWHASLRAARYYDTIRGVHDDTLYAAFPHGEIGVLMFFMLSGFVVSQPFLARPRHEWRVSQFYTRRFIRIFPPYAVALSLSMLVLGVVGYVPTNANAFQQRGISLVGSLVASLFYVHSFVFDAPSRLNPPVWSLELEVLFYACVPLLITAYLRVARRGARLLMVAVLVVLNIVLLYGVGAFASLDVRFRWGMAFHGYFFLTGIALADAMARSALRPRTRRIAFDAVFLLGVAALLGVGLEMTQYDARLPEGLRSILLQLLATGALVAIFLGAFSGRFISRALSLPWVGLIGTMCYSIYLTHIVVMQALSEGLAHVVRLESPAAIWLLWLGVLLPGALVVGLLFYLAVERPFAAAASGRQRPATQEIPQAA